MAASKCFGWAALLLALAFPPAAGAVLAVLAAAASVALAHPSLACTLAAAVLLTSALRGIRHRRMARLLGGRVADVLLGTIDPKGGSR